MANDDRVKHLEFVQAVINRLSTNSFFLKGWSVVLTSALFALAAKDANQLFVYLAYFPAAAFWGLDGYFLWQERLFRALYDHVRASDAPADFSMDTRIVSASTAGWAAATLSRTLLAFHGTVVLTILAVMLLTLLR